MLGRVLLFIALKQNSTVVAAQQALPGQHTMDKPIGRIRQLTSLRHWTPKRSYVWCV